MVTDDEPSALFTIQFRFYIFLTICDKSPALILSRIKFEAFTTPNNEQNMGFSCIYILSVYNYNNLFNCSHKQ